MKICSKCKNKFPATAEYFYHNKSKKDGLQSQCKRCRNEYHRQYREENPEKMRERDRRWREQNPEKERERGRRWYEQNPEKAREHSRRWGERNREKERERGRRWRELNPEKERERGRRLNKRRQQEPRLKLGRNVSRGIRGSLKAGKSGRHWETLVGYTVDDLKTHFESQFTKGMTWDNMGEWHIDHIRPIADFTFETPDDPGFKACWSLWNLQPLWAKENRVKNDKCNAPPLPLIHSKAKGNEV